MTRKSWGENLKNTSFNDVISHEKKLRRQLHVLLNTAFELLHLWVHGHKSSGESAIFGKKEEHHHKNLQNNFCNLLPRARLQDTDRETQHGAELRRCGGGHGSHSRTHRSAHGFGIPLCGVLWEEWTFWQLLSSAALRRKCGRVMVLGSTSATAPLSGHLLLRY